MARITIYKNSILATICSLFGYGFTLMAVLSLIRGELEILEGLVMLAIGIGLSVLGGFISARKAKKKQAKAANTPAAAAGNARPQQKVTYSGQAATVQFTPAPVKAKKPVKAAALLAGFFFLLAGLAGLGAEFLVNEGSWEFLQVSPSVVEYGACIVLMIAAIWMRCSQKVPVLCILGLLCMIAGDLLMAQYYYLFPGEGALVMQGQVMQNRQMTECLITAGVHGLMFIFAILSTKKAKQYCGGFVRALWWVAPLMLILLLTAYVVQNQIVGRITLMIERATLLNMPQVFTAVAKAPQVLAMLLLGYCFRRICKKEEPVYQPAQQPAAPVQQRPIAPVQPAAQRPVQQVPVQQPPVQRPVQQQPVQPVAYAQPVMQRPVQETPAQAQYTPRHATAAVNPQPVQAQANQQDMEKKRQAYKDLLDCGILSQAEYDEKMRELMHG